MIDTYGGYSVNEIATTIASVVAAIGALSLAFKTVRAWVAEQFKKLRGNPVSQKDLEGLKAELLEAIADQYNTLHEEMSSLGGQIAEVLSGMKGFGDRMGIMESMLRITADRDEGLGSVYCDEHGAITYASKSLCDWMDADRAELMGMRWLRFVQMDQRAVIRNEIPQANQEHREVRLEINMGPDGQPKRSYLFVLAPMPDNPPLQAWAGFFRPIAA